MYIIIYNGGIERKDEREWGGRDQQLERVQDSHGLWRMPFSHAHACTARTSHAADRRRPVKGNGGLAGADLFPEKEKM